MAGSGKLLLPVRMQLADAEGSKRAKLLGQQAVTLESPTPWLHLPLMAIGSAREGCPMLAEMMMRMPVLAIMHP